MNIENREFDNDFYTFRHRMKELDRRLASILTQGFDDSDTIIGKFKLLDSLRDSSTDQSFKMSSRENISPCWSSTSRT